jgi:hypothetical protein
MLEVLGERDSALCYFYLENSIVEKWNLQDHALWLKKAEDFISRLNAQSSEVALQRLYVILDEAKRLSALSDFELHFLMSLLLASSAQDAQSP